MRVVGVVRVVGFKEIQRSIELFKREASTEMPVYLISENGEK